MRFRLLTLVDITETGARRGEDSYKLKQQQNFLTIIQTIGRRVNPTYNKSPKIIEDTPSKYGFGKNFKSKQKIWEFEIDIEYEDALTLDILENDFNLIPFIDNLDETAKFKNPVFLTKKSQDTNIIFEIDDK